MASGKGGQGSCCWYLGLLVATWLLRAVTPGKITSFMKESTREDNEAEAVHSLLQPALVHAGPHAPVLIIVGAPRWLDVLLQQRMGTAEGTATTTVVLLEKPTGPWPNRHFFSTFAKPSAFLVVAENHPSDLMASLRLLNQESFNRLLIWTSEQEYPEQYVWEQLGTAIARWHETPRSIQLVVTQTESRIKLYVFSIWSDKNTTQSFRVDTWTPPKTWSTDSNLPCYFLGNASTSLRYIDYNLTETQLFDAIGAFSSSVLAAAQGSPKKFITINHKNMTDYVRTCNFDVVVSGRYIHVPHARIYTTYPWEATRLMALVPVGLGKRKCFLDSVTSEFSNPLWLATAVFCVAVAGVLMVSSGRTTSILDAIAPLLAQPATGGQSNSNRTLLGSWLLVCVVLSAAYTGRLLPELMGKCPSSNIQTTREILARNLTIYLQPDCVHVEEEKILKYIPSRRLKTLDLLNVPKALYDVAIGRNSTIVLSHWQSRLLLEPDLSLYSQKIHQFLLPTTYFPTLFVTKKGVPFEPVLRRVLSSFRAGGLNPLLVNRFRNRDDVRGFKFWIRRGNTTRHTPLQLSELRALFLLLGVGQVLSTIAFVVELATKLKKFSAN